MQDQLVEARRPLTGYHVLAILVAFFGVVIGVNLALAFFANSSWPGLVVENSYVASQNFDKDMKTARLQHAAGWKNDIALTRSELHIAISDGQGKPLPGLTVKVVLRRPATESQDTSHFLVDQGHGIYTAPVAVGVGLWEADITAQGSDQLPVRNVMRLVVK